MCDDFFEIVDNPESQLRSVREPHNFSPSVKGVACSLRLFGVPTSRYTTLQNSAEATTFPTLPPQQMQRGKNTMEENNLIRWDIPFMDDSLQPKSTMMKKV